MTRETIDKVAVGCIQPAWPGISPANSSSLDSSTDNNNIVCAIREIRAHSQITKNEKSLSVHGILPSSKEIVLFLKFYILKSGHCSGV